MGQWASRFHIVDHLSSVVQTSSLEDWVEVGISWGKRDVGRGRGVGVVEGEPLGGVELWWIVVKLKIYGE